MKLEINEELLNATPAIVMMIFTWVAAGIVTYIVSDFDVVVHTNYVLPIQAFCYGSNPNSPQGNPDPFCIAEYKILGLQVGDQAHIGSPYWNLLALFMYFLAIAITMMRLSTSIILRMVTKWEFTWVTIYTSFATFTTIISLLSAAWGDSLYYWIQGLPIPTSLPWDDGIFYFPTILGFTHDQHVMQLDLYLSMAIGGLIAFGVWIPVLIAFAKHDRSVKELL